MKKEDFEDILKKEGFTQIDSDFDDECESLYQAILRASEVEYASEIGTNHQQMMADSRNKVKQLAKKYEKK